MPRRPPAAQAPDRGAADRSSGEGRPRAHGAGSRGRAVATRGRRGAAGRWPARVQPAASRDRSRDARADRAPRARQRYDGPPIPEEITGKELDRSVQAQLKSLPEKLALRVARHLVAAGQLIDSEPETAYEHTLAARARASRLAVVREAVGEAAYAAGEYAEALAELRAAKRMNGVRTTSRSWPTASGPSAARTAPGAGPQRAREKLSPGPAGGADDRRGRRPARPRRARRRAAHPGDARTCSPSRASRGWRVCATPTPTLCSGRAPEGRPHLVPPHRGRRRRRRHRRRRAGRRTRASLESGD